jgi:hypothetical protein
MWCLAEFNEDYIAKMEDVLEVYEHQYAPREPVVCLDEKPVTLYADVRPASPAKPGREARTDNESERRGTVNIFLRSRAESPATSPLPRRIVPHSSSPKWPWTWLSSTQPQRPST